MTYISLRKIVTSFKHFKMQLSQTFTMIYSFRGSPWFTKESLNKIIEFLFKVPIQFIFHNLVIIF